MKTYHKQGRVTLDNGRTFLVDEQIVKLITDLNNMECVTINSCFFNTNDCLWIEFDLDDYKFLNQIIIDAQRAGFIGRDLVEFMENNAAAIVIDSDDEDGDVYFSASLRVPAELKRYFIFDLKRVKAYYDSVINYKN